MKTLVFVFLLLYAIERCLETFWKRPKIAGRIIASYSITLLVSAYVAFYLAILWEAVRWSEAATTIWKVLAGIFMVFLSMLGRNWAILSLGPYHSIQIEIRNSHRLITAGPYRYVRNPYYLSNIIEAAGLALIINSRVVIIFLLIYLLLLAHRIILEEKALQKHFGAAFDDVYKKRVPRLLPKLLQVLREKHLPRVVVVNSSSESEKDVV